MLNFLPQICERINISLQISLYWDQNGTLIIYPMLFPIIQILFITPNVQKIASIN
ncbi:hypothetical protein Lalb_Chr10g0092561 [Lupinus albus]|uniref:Uncharacterized protein n=1 Tax=Lupinus albus TaxID=3870 RepID=A0A6A4PUM6_LUPAL|nr:hypothetical protein Lalb_Chr10g0092561 [Lupinus albus]